MQPPIDHLPVTLSHGGRFIQYNIFGNVFEVTSKYKPPIMPIGKGTYGIVCSALNSETNEHVSLKKIANSFNNKIDAKRTLREIKLLWHMDHENVKNNIKESPNDIQCQTLGILQVVHVESSQNLNPLQYGDLATGLSTTAGKENEHEKLFVDATSSIVSSNLVTLDEQSMMSSKSSAQFAVLNDKFGRITKELGSNLLNESASQIEFGSDATGTEGANLNDSMSQANQGHLIEVLEQAIGDARNNKSVISLMREVELKKEATEQAKVEAAMAGFDVLAKVEELKQMIQQEKEANCMLAGEVHGEKSILASELRVPQSRVLSLSEDRDISLAVLDERKVEKEKVTMEALADEELIMEKVMQEAKMLKQQARR